MYKISAAKMIEVLSEIGPALRKMAAERDEAVARAEGLELEKEVAKVATAMIDPGMSSEPYEQLCAQLEKAAMEGNLTRIKDAVDLSGPDMGDKIAHIANNESYSVDASSASEASLLNFIIGNVG